MTSAGPPQAPVGQPSNWKGDLGLNTYAATGRTPPNFGMPQGPTGPTGPQGPIGQPGMAGAEGEAPSMPTPTPFPGSDEFQNLATQRGQDMTTPMPPTRPKEPVWAEDTQFTGDLLGETQGATWPRRPVPTPQTTPTPPPVANPIQAHQYGPTIGDLMEPVPQPPVPTTGPNPLPTPSPTPMPSPQTMPMPTTPGQPIQPGQLGPGPSGLAYPTPGSPQPQPPRTMDFDFQPPKSPLRQPPLTPGARPAGAQGPTGTPGAAGTPGARPGSRPSPKTSPNRRAGRRYRSPGSR